MAIGEQGSVQRVRFDLGRGLVSVDEASYRMLVPTDLLLDLLGQADSEAAWDFGRRVGNEAGRRIAERLGERTKTASVEVLLEHLADEIALLGLGCLGLERWGRALVLTVKDSPLGKKGDELLSRLLEGALMRALGRDAGVVVLDRSDELVRLLVASPSTAGRLRKWLGSGTPWAEALTHLHVATSGAGGAR